MSIITLQIGQCGNQLGLAFFSHLSALALPSDPLSRSISSTFFRQITHPNHPKSSNQPFLLIARCILIDTEIKVIQHVEECAKKTQVWRYGKSNQYCLHAGAANNWAYGYELGKLVYEGIKQKIRYEISKCNQQELKGFLVLQSMAGGTGSGVGSFIVECLKREFTNVKVVNKLIWPFSMGEVAVQNYNVVMCVAHVHKASTAVLVSENDKVRYICKQRLGLKKVGYEEMNSVIAQVMVHILVPFKLNGEFTAFFDWLEDSNKYKMFTVKYLPQTSVETAKFSRITWASAVKRILFMSLDNSVSDERVSFSVNPLAAFNLIDNFFSKSDRHLLLLRGNELEDVAISLFESPHIYASNVDFVVGTSRALGKIEKSAFLLSSCNSIVHLIEPCLDKAIDMFRNSAYFFQYERYGLSSIKFERICDYVDQLIERYNKMH